MKKILGATVVMFLVLALGGGISAAPKFNLTIMPLSGLGSTGFFYYEGMLAPMSTEIGVPVGNRLELVAGLDYYADKDAVGSGSISLLNLGTRYFLTDDAQLKPFLFGNYGAVFMSGDADNGDSHSLAKAGIGAVAPINGRWGVVAQTGLSWLFYKDGSTGDKETETSTFSSFGLRYSF